MLFLISCVGISACSQVPVVEAVQGAPLKICAAENEMPYSNTKGEGFENKLAEFLGKELGRKIEYVSWKDPRYFIRDLLDKKQCDLVMGLDTGDPRVATTEAYYRSGYVFITKEQDADAAQNWDGELIKKAKKIAFMPGTPAETMLRAIGRYNDMFNYQHELVGFKSPRNQYVKYDASKLVGEVASGKAEVAVLWAPAAARYVKESTVPLAMTVIPDTNVRADGQKVAHHFSTSMGVRKDDRDLLAALNGIIKSKQDEIDGILEAENIPLLSETESALAKNN
ncbi:MAG: methanol oxidation system protein MoxJ [Methylococcaceae bacterium]|nr:methanol oxidation system protein MoxJ [Methylococcaceae bacterium]